MKNFLIALPLCAAIGTTLAFAGHSLIGRWNAAYGNGPKGKMVFRNNGTFEATFTGQKWKVGGQYKVTGNTVAFSDSTCGFGYWGQYQMTWYSDDSVMAKVIADTCSGRRGNGNGAVIVRARR
ncbi:MAG TPA: hypothetical protein VMH27_03465 [Puia sp.]|nr:hypothetical protein [Puia sp.]